MQLHCRGKGLKSVSGVKLPCYMHTARACMGEATCGVEVHGKYSHLESVQFRVREV